MRLSTTLFAAFKWHIQVNRFRLRLNIFKIMFMIRKMAMTAIVIVIVALCAS